MKKLLLIWTSGPLSCRLGPRQILEISRRLITLKSSFPSEFSRKSRSLKDLKHWKATEFRSFLLYSGPIVLCGILKDSMFHHFMLFHTAISILTGPSATKREWVNFAGSILEQFVQQMSTIYFKEMLVYNVHGLLHLHLDVLRHGKLDNFSAFEFENGMQYLKRLVRSNANHLSQVIKRVYENDGNITSSIKIPSETRFSDRPGDNFFMSSDFTVYKIIEYVDKDNYKCQLYKSAGDVLGYPCSSSKFGILVLNETQKFLVINRSVIFKKCFVGPYKDSFVSLPVLNS